MHAPETKDVEWQSLAKDGKKIEAIKLYRVTRGTSLKEAKDAIEAWMEGRDPPIKLDVMVEEREALKANILLRRSTAFDSCLYFIRGDVSFKDAGYASLEEALKGTINQAHTLCKNMMETFEKKYPI